MKTSSLLNPTSWYLKWWILFDQVKQPWFIRSHLQAHFYLHEPTQRKEPICREDESWMSQMAYLCLHKRASHYSSSVQKEDELGWQRPNRYSERTATDAWRHIDFWPWMHFRQSVCQAAQRAPSDNWIYPSLWGPDTCSWKSERQGRIIRPNNRAQSGLCYEPSIPAVLLRM